MADREAQGSTEQNLTGCLRWRFVPVFGFIAFFWMAEHSGRMVYRKLGRTFGAMSVTAFLLSSPLFRMLANYQISRINGGDHTGRFTQLSGNILFTVHLLGILMVFVLWLTVLIQVQLRKKQYLQACAGAVGRTEIPEAGKPEKTVSSGNGGLIGTAKEAPRKPDVQAERIPQAEPVRESPAAVSGTKKININLATQSELQQLPGVDAATAIRAVEHREKNGAFSSVQEFIDLYRIKPHFAIRLPDLAEVTVKEETPARTVSGTVKRTLDF